jgi:hypothetical protein
MRQVKKNPTIPHETQKNLKLQKSLVEEREKENRNTLIRAKMSCGKGNYHYSYRLT